MEQIDISRLIPQRAPIRMVDELLSCSDGQATSRLLVSPDNFFIDADGLMTETGMIEHMAQSASAMAGWEALKAGATEPPVGFIGEVKNFRLHRRPAPGTVLETTITRGPDVEGVTIVMAETRSDGETLAESQLKIYVNEG